MKVNKYKTIEDLLERFFEGETSNAEEQRLYQFFAGNDIPEYLLRYKPVFTYFKTGIKEELTEKPAPGRVRRPKWQLLMGVAAALLGLILLSPFYIQKPFDPYEGSYIVRNGMRITDPEIIRPELEAAIQRVLEQEEKVEDLEIKLMKIADYPKSAEDQMQEQKSEILNQFQDEYIRNEVRKILDVK